MLDVVVSYPMFKDTWYSKKQQVDIGPGPVFDGKKIEADGPPCVG